MTVKFGVSFQAQNRMKTLCLISLSDAWRRGAEFDDPSLAKKFNASARILCAAAQYFDLDSLDGRSLGESWPREKAQAALQNILEFSRGGGVERIILPVYEESPIGAWIKERVIKEVDTSDVDVELQEHPYMSRLHHIGNIDRRKKTALNYGLAYVVE